MACRTPHTAYSSAVAAYNSRTYNISFSEPWSVLGIQLEPKGHG